VQFRSERLPDGDVKGPQADIGLGWWGKLSEAHGRDMGSDGAGEQHVKVDDWNEYKIVAQGSSVRTWINGVLSVNTHDPQIARHGIFAIEMGANGVPMEVRFKHMKLTLVGPKPAVPDEAALVGAEEEAHKVYKEEYDKTGGPGALVMAERCLRDGLDTEGNPAMRYVLLQKARDLAAVGGDIPLALRAAGTMADHFAVDVLEMKTAALESAGRAATNIVARWPGCAVAALGLADDAEEGDKYEEAERLAKVAQTATARLPDRSLATLAEARVNELAALRRTYESLSPVARRLSVQPADADANLALGRFHALSRGDWDRGLAALSRGSDPKLKALAEADLASPGDVEGAERLGDSYTAHAAAQGGAERTNLLWRASYWYDQATGKLSGNDRARVGAKVATIEKTLPPSRPVILHASYGAFGGRADLSDRVRWLVIETPHHKLVHTFGRLYEHFGIADPAPGQYKSMVVVYRYRGGVHLSIAGESINSVKLTIPAPLGALDTAPGHAAPGQELVILQARFGNEGTYADATAKTQAAVRGRTLIASPDIL
jgi:hypothetical protein